MEAAPPSTTPQLFSDGQSTDMRDVLSFLHAERHTTAWTTARANDNDVKKLQVTSGNQMGQANTASGNQMGQANTASGNQRLQANTASDNLRLQASTATDKLDRPLDQAECDALAAHVSTYGPPLSQQVAEELRARVALLSEEIQLQDVS